ncbi:MAG: hypothetical protein ACK4WH_09500, partial [Phycisphaerales bacterium]
MVATIVRRVRMMALPLMVIAALVVPASALAQTPTDAAAAKADHAAAHKPGGEANLKLPDVGTVKFFNDAIDGHTLLLIGIGVSIAGMIFGLMIYAQLKSMPVHKSMLEISELIYATCK